MIKQCMYKICALLSLTFLTGCFGLEVGQPFQHIAPGPWLGVFGFSSEIPSKLMELHKDSLIQDKVPINFFVNSDANGKPLNFQFVSNTDTVTSDSIKFWGDSVFVFFHENKTNLRAVFEVDNMQGYLYDMEEKDYPVQFRAKSGSFARFPDIRRAPIADLNGNWNLLIASNENEDIFEGKLNFLVKGNIALATIESSDINPKMSLEGTIQGKHIYLSGFNGKTVIFLSGELSADGKNLVKTSLRISDEVYDLKGTKE